MYIIIIVTWSKGIYMGMTSRYSVKGITGLRHEVVVCTGSCSLIVYFNNIHTPAMLLGFQTNLTTLYYIWRNLRNPYITHIQEKDKQVNDIFKKITYQIFKKFRSWEKKHICCIYIWNGTTFFVFFNNSKHLTVMVWIGIKCRTFPVTQCIQVYPMLTVGSLFH